MTKTLSNQGMDPEKQNIQGNRLSERFWPYGDLSEQPTEEELITLESDLRAGFFQDGEETLSVTLVFPVFKGADYEEAVTRAKASAEYREVGTGETLRHRARFFPGEVFKLRDLYDLISRNITCEVLINDRPVPYARDLWLPLIWFLTFR